MISTVSMSRSSMTLLLVGTVISTTRAEPPIPQFTCFEDSGDVLIKTNLPRSRHLEEDVLLDQFQTAAATCAERDLRIHGSGLTWSADARSKSMYKFSDDDFNTDSLYLTRNVASLSNASPENFLNWIVVTNGVKGSHEAAWVTPYFNGLLKVNDVALCNNVVASMNQLVSVGDCPQLKATFPTSTGFSCVCGNDFCRIAPDDARYCDGGVIQLQQTCAIDVRAQCVTVNEIQVLGCDAVDELIATFTAFAEHTDNFEIEDPTRPQRFTFNGDTFKFGKCDRVSSSLVKKGNELESCKPMAQMFSLAYAAFKTKQFSPCSFAPTITPTQIPTQTPSRIPTAMPSSSTPSASPTKPPTTAPTETPTHVPTTSSPTFTPTASPTTAKPTIAPTLSPSTASPTQVPTRLPSDSPTASPTVAPTWSPTLAPTAAPTMSPTNSPTQSPTSTPTNAPTTSSPTTVPSRQPTSSSPTGSPTSSRPTTLPTQIPTQPPTLRPTVSVPTHAPSIPPTAYPTVSSPTAVPSAAPVTRLPTTIPSTLPTSRPTSHPTTTPTNSQPTLAPSKPPTGSPSTSWPTPSPSNSPSTPLPTTSPTTSPTLSTPTSSPTQSSPTQTPTYSPSSSSPTRFPTTSNPTTAPTQRCPDPPSCQQYAMYFCTLSSVADECRSLCGGPCHTASPITQVPTSAPTLPAPTHVPSQWPTVLPTISTASPTTSPVGGCWSIAQRSPDWLIKGRFKQGRYYAVVTYSGPNDNNVDLFPIVRDATGNADNILSESGRIRNLPSQGINFKFSLKFLSKVRNGNYSMSVGMIPTGGSIASKYRHCETPSKQFRLITEYMDLDSHIVNVGIQTTRPTLTFPITFKYFATSAVKFAVVLSCSLAPSKRIGQNRNCDGSSKFVRGQNVSLGYDFSKLSSERYFTASETPVHVSILVSLYSGVPTINADVQHVDVQVVMGYFDETSHRWIDSRDRTPKVKLMVSDA